MYRSLLAVALGSVLAACSLSPKAIPMQEFRCDDGGVLSVSFHKNQATVMLPDGQVVALAQQPAASGFHYSSGRHDLRGKGNEVSWAIGRRAPTICQATST